MKITKRQLKQIIKEELKNESIPGRIKAAGKEFMQEPYHPEGSDDAFFRQRIVFQKKLYNLLSDWMTKSGGDVAVEVGMTVEDVALLAGIYLGDKTQSSFDMRDARGDFDELKKELGIK